MNAPMLDRSGDRSQGASMDLPGSAYLYSLSVVSTTYVGFSALLVGLRQAKGDRLTAYDAYFTLTFIQIGFIVTICSLLPPLIGLYGCPVNVVWRIASVIAAVPILWFVASVPSPRHAATGMPVPRFIRLIPVLQGAAGVAMLVSAMTSHLVEPGAIYATAMTVILASSAVAYILALELIRPKIEERD